MAVSCSYLDTFLRTRALSLKLRAPFLSHCNCLSGWSAQGHSFCLLVCISAVSPTLSSSSSVRRSGASLPSGLNDGLSHLASRNPYALLVAATAMSSSFPQDYDSPKGRGYYLRQPAPRMRYIVGA